MLTCKDVAKVVGKIIHFYLWSRKKMTKQDINATYCCKLTQILLCSIMFSLASWISGKFSSPLYITSAKSLVLTFWSNTYMSINFYNHCLYYTTTQFILEFSHVGDAPTVYCHKQFGTMLGRLKRNIILDIV